MLASVRARAPMRRWHAVGVSLGGNALLKYVGEQQQAVDWLGACAGISVPLDLVAGGNSLSLPRVHEPPHLQRPIFCAP